MDPDAASKYAPCRALRLLFLVAAGVIIRDITNTKRDIHSKITKITQTLNYGFAFSLLSSSRVLLKSGSNISTAISVLLR